MPEQTFNERPRILNDFADIPKTEDGDNEQDGLESQLKRFSEHVIGYCARLGNASANEREKTTTGGKHNMGYAERHAWESRKVRNEVEVTWATETVKDSLGEDSQLQEYVSGGSDAHCSQGLGVGFSQEAARHWTAYANQKMFMLNRRPYTIQPMGFKRQEGDKAKKVLYAVLDHVLKLSKFEEIARLLPDQSGGHGAGILRYELSTQKKMVRQPDGSFQEVAGDLIPNFRLWPLEHFYVSDWKEPDINRQRAVWWVEPTTYLSELEPDEMVFDMEQQIVSGRFINLDVLREEDADDSETHPTANSDSQSVAGSRPRTKIECDIELPIRAMVKDGILTPELLNHFRVNVTLESLTTDENPSGLPDPDNEDEMRQWADKVAQIAIWNVAWVSEPRWGGQDQQFPETGVLIRCEASRTHTPRNTGYKFQYQPESRSFLCDGIPMAGYHFEKMGEVLFNSNAAIKARMGNPNYAVNPAGFDDNLDISKFSRLANGFGNVLAFAKMDGMVGGLNDSIWQMPNTPIMNYEVEMADIQNKFERACGIGAAIKSGGDAAPSTGTATEMQANMQTSQLRLDDALILAGKSFGDLMHDIVEDLVFSYQTEDFYKMCSRVSGQAISQIKKWFPSPDNIADEFYFDHPLHALQDQTVLATLIMRLWQVTGGMAFKGDAEHLAKIIFDVSGMPNQTERLMGEMAYGSPEDEHDQMKAGNYVEVEPNEDIASHAIAHLSRWKQLIEVELPQNPDNPESQLELELLLPHLQATLNNQRIMAQTQLAGIGQQAGPVSAGGQAPKLSSQQGGGQSQGPQAGGGTKDQNEGDSAPSTPRKEGGEAAQIKGNGGNSE